MPYVRCSTCGVPTYAAPPHVLSAECPVCGHQLLPAGVGGRRERPSVVEQQAAERLDFDGSGAGGAGPSR